MKYKWVIVIREWIGSYIHFECFVIRGNIKKDFVSYVSFEPYDKIRERDLLKVKKEMIFNSEEEATSKLGLFLNEAIAERIK